METRPRLRSEPEPEGDSDEKGESSSPAGGDRDVERTTSFLIDKGNVITGGNLSKNIFLAIVTLSILGLFVLVIVKMETIAGLVIVILLILVIMAGAYSVYIFFAPNDLFWGGVPEEGTACTIVAGTENRKGKFIKAQMSFEGSKFDKDWNVVPDEEFQKGKKSFLEQIGLGGIFWIGIPGIRRRYKHLFSWSSMLPNGELDPHEGIFDYIPLKEDTYATLIPKAEAAKSMVPMDITLLITVKVINPMKAGHKVDHWLQSVINLTKVPALAYIAQLDNPRELIGNKELIDLFFKGHEMSKLIKYFKDEYGVEVSRVNVAAIGLGKEEEDAAMLQWKAERTGEAYQTKIGMETTADVQRIEDIASKVQEFGDLGLTIEYLKAAEKSGKIVLPPPTMIGDAIKQALGGDKSSDEIVEILKEAGMTKKSFIKAIKEIKEANEER